MMYSESGLSNPALQQIQRDLRAANVAPKVTFPDRFMTIIGDSCKARAAQSSSARIAADKFPPPTKLPSITSKRQSAGSERVRLMSITEPAAGDSELPPQLARSRLRGVQGAMVRKRPQNLLTVPNEPAIALATPPMSGHGQKYFWASPLPQSSQIDSSHKRSSVSSRGSMAYASPASVPSSTFSSPPNSPLSGPVVANSSSSSSSNTKSSNTGSTNHRDSYARTQQKPVLVNAPPIYLTSTSSAAPSLAGAYPVSSPVPSLVSSAPSSAPSSAASSVPPSAPTVPYMHYASAPSAPMHGVPYGMPVSYVPPPVQAPPPAPVAQPAPPSASSSTIATKPTERATIPIASTSTVKATRNVPGYTSTSPYSILPQKGMTSSHSGPTGRVGKQPVRDPEKLKDRIWLQQNRMHQDKLHQLGFRIMEGSNGTKVCSLCNVSFSKEMFVWRHAWLHVTEKPFHCNVCSQKFTRSDTLQRHVRRTGHSLSTDTKDSTDTKEKASAATR